MHFAIQPAESAEKDPILAWKQTRGLPYVPSPLAYAKRIFLVKNGGMVSCLDASSGAFVYREERVGALGDYCASPIGVGNHVLIASQREPSRYCPARPESLKVDHQIDFEEGIMATPAMVSGRLFVRISQKNLLLRAPMNSFRRPPDYLDLREFAAMLVMRLGWGKGKHRRFHRPSSGTQGRPHRLRWLLLPKVGRSCEFFWREKPGRLSCVS